MSDEKPKRKKPSKSPTQRSLALMLAHGHTCQVVERWNPFARVRQDLFGFVDIVAVGPLIGIVGVQATSSPVAARLEKIYAEPRARKWLAAGGRIEIHGWTLKGARGKRKTYQLRCVRVYLDGEAIAHEEMDSEIPGPE